MTFRSLFGHLGTKAQKSGFLEHCKNDGFFSNNKSFEPQLSPPLPVPKEQSRNIPESRVQP